MPPQSDLFESEHIIPHLRTPTDLSREYSSFMILSHSFESIPMFLYWVTSGLLEAQQIPKKHKRIDKENIKNIVIFPSNTANTFN